MDSFLDRISHLDYLEVSRELHIRLEKFTEDSQSFQRDFQFSIPAKPAAVLAPLLKVDQEWSLLFIRRTDNLEEHSGQVAFPGGHMDPSDSSPADTCIRETKEEIGVHPDDILLVGRLPSFLTVTNFHITPFVGLIPYPYPFKADPHEVSRIFTIPLHWLADSNNYDYQTRTLPPPVGEVRTIYYRTYNGELLWGATAQMVHHLLSILSHK